MKKNIFFVLLLYCSAWGSLHAASTDEEIGHLLQFVEQSQCTFERNGKLYSSHQARAHISRKYSHIKKRVKNTEDFIRYAATQSSITGKKYHATCNGETITSEAWLSNELSRYRQRER